MKPHEATKMIKRLNTTLPDNLARYVGAITGKGGNYETPSEFIRDWVRRHMETTEAKEDRDIQALLMQFMAENNYQPWGEQNLQDARDLINS
ncbi:hypothetical protein AB835_02625 [Candidatus Endobugula sertula]|uniref:CopG family transcriptional regulator n=1 Tax=Candidatus Endobugula sertula TaxID=62101 RepID=A0A1D2QSS5_9GAMM|nr:hypothetical protein AB835_02625 [Candidatus Endobugula sertula]